MGVSCLFKRKVLGFCIDRKSITAYKYYILLHDEWLYRKNPLEFCKDTKTIIVQLETNTS